MIMEDVDRWLLAAGISLEESSSACDDGVASVRQLARGCDDASRRAARGAGVGFDASAAARASTNLPTGASAEAANAALELGIRRGQKRRAEESSGTAIAVTKAAQGTLNARRR
jgi:hypothetical protein